MVERQQLIVNGAPVSVSAEPAMPLLWALRDLLHLRGTKYGCGIAQCRACTVHLDGQVMGAVALLRANPKPDDAAIDEAMQPHLCRCGTYLRIRAAIHRASAMLAARPVKSAHR